MEIRAVVFVGAFYVDAITDGDLLDLAGVNVAHELREGDRFIGPRLGCPDHLPQQHQHTCQYHPEYARFNI
jgi:hypothetical protein